MRKVILRAVLGVVVGLGSAWDALAQETATPPPPSDGTAAPTTDSAATAAATASGDGTDGSEAAQPLERSIDSNASFTETISIDVPAFHGLEPALALAYDSGRRNGFVGVGWRLSGLSVIERASVRFGAPRYDDATDVFVLDGEELVACAGISSPSCSTGGTHATRSESYVRIKRDITANTWEVTSRNGTKMIYQAVATWGSYNAGDPDAVKRATNFRWLLASAADTHGNIVQYSYSCDGVPDCYIDTIAYNGNTVRFYRETRTDPISYATGAGLASINYRLKSIDVQVGGQRVRAYALSYSTSTATSRSRLASVQQFGRDATVDGAGTVSGGTSLPPISLSATEPAYPLQNAGDWGAGQTGKPDNLWVPADLNGDGREDFVYTGPSCTLSVRLSTGSGYTAQDWTATGCTSAPTDIDFVADVTGDGKDDVVALGGADSKVYRSTGTGFVFETWLNQNSTADGLNWIAADLNGDGKMDAAKKNINTSTCTVAVRLAGNNAFSEQQWSAGSACADGYPTTTCREATSTATARSTL